MHAIRLGRLCAFAVGIWFATAVTGRAGAHRCPVHDAPAPTTPAHTDHGSHHDGGHEAHEPGDGSNGHDCSCIEHCCSFTNAAAPQVRLVQLALAPRAAVGFVASDGLAVPSALDSSVLFPTGPPSALLA